MIYNLYTCIGGENFTKKVTEQKWLKSWNFTKRAKIGNFRSKLKNVLNRARDGPTGLKDDQTDMEFVTNGICVKPPEASCKLLKK